MDNSKQAEYADPVEQMPPRPAYQVGKTEDGKVTLQLGGLYGAPIITMTNTGVRQLIRMLESAMENENDHAS